MKADAYIRLRNPESYLRILKGDSFGKGRVALSVAGGRLHIEVEASSRKSIASAIGGVKKQVAIIGKALELLE